ncbi:carnitine O-palmitoyltransferase 1, liver isoform isoform X1 [Patella vulgata]|uniref:carnitine O-palmitoyltransferase 1, liver isoform isoform X1 n=2 Tax=Patella vulgata TaxID=6465 RepID=UPI0021807D5D|nr:carnitine O-palmitoyltransferase 1, liver isoform isoform X1 [Patella vulgata]
MEYNAERKAQANSAKSGIMAEAHAAVAFSFSVTPDGVNVAVNHEALWAVFYSGTASWKRKLHRIQNSFHNGIYPASPMSWLFTLTIVLAFGLAGVDVSWGIIKYIQNHVPGIDYANDTINFIISSAIFGTVLWVAVINFIKFFLRILFNYQNWMYEVRGKKVSLKTKLWVVLVRVLSGRKPKLNSYQASLPKLPVPSVEGTMERYLLSVRPLLDDEKYNRMEKLANEFKEGLGNKLQRYLTLKSWWAANYVSDWWEEYVYLRGRAPIMINSNFYGIDAVYVKPTDKPLARAGNVIYSMLKFRCLVDREELEPIILNKTVPLCSSQYERQFNTTRIPGTETDKLVQYHDSSHISVYHKGRYFKVYIRSKGRLLMPCEIEYMLQKIVDDDSEPAEGEKELAALTAGERVAWAKARTEYFSKGKNRASLDAIEKAAFCVSLDEDSQDFNLEKPKLLDAYGKAMLHGKGYDRWFDKSFTLVVCSNGRIGFNAEHSWADAPIMAHLWEYAISEDSLHLGYTEDGHCKGSPEQTPPNPIRLEWDIPKPCQTVIDQQLQIAKQLISDVDLHLLVHTAFGKGFIKKCKVSPDAFLQIALQLAYFRSAGKFCLTYESSMTRLFREGRTETVRSCTIKSCDFVKSMTAGTQTGKELIAKFREAADQHQQGYRDAMTGKGIDRHLFCLYVVSKYLGVDSPFLAEVLSEPWRLSTSQTPHQQTNRIDLVKHPKQICAGGGFGPVADDGYGVSYIVAGEDIIFFHISCKRSCSTTDANKFGAAICKAMADIRNLFESN